MKTRETKTYKIRFIIIAGAVVIAGAGTAIAINRMTVKTSQAAPTVMQQAPLKQSDTITYSGIKGKTALTQLKETTANVVTKSSSYGDYVDSIGNLIGGTDSKYWSFYVDGKLASVGASAYTSIGGEKIEWKFEKLQ
jgi:hypothetical protein